MSGSSLGLSFRVTTAGESHGPANIAIVDGCPPGLPIDEGDLQIELDRRRPGQSELTTQRREPDHVEILSGVFEGCTTGTPIALLIRNQDQRSKDYREIKDVYRPGHADFTYDAKYGFRDYRGGGRASARETVARVAAGAIARKLIASLGIEVLAYTSRVGDIVVPAIDIATLSRDFIEANSVRCPNQRVAARMAAAIKDVRKGGDSLGGQCEVVATGVPSGLGEPVFDKLKADLAKAIMSIPAVVAFEYGIGIDAAGMRGSECNDIFITRGENIETKTNRHGGMLGGITTGMPIRLRATLKPTSSLPIAQSTVNRDGESVEIRTKGRHDPCLLPRFAPIAESMVCLILADHLVRHRGQTGFPFSP